MIPINAMEPANAGPEYYAPESYADYYKIQWVSKCETVKTVSRKGSEWSCRSLYDVRLRSWLECCRIELPEGTLLPWFRQRIGSKQWFGELVQPIVPGVPPETEQGSQCAVAAIHCG